jgi:signal transduction histidine kinase/CheY-like chemotaxis protein
MAKRPTEPEQTPSTGSKRDLRDQADARAAQLPEPPESVLPEEAQRVLHELRERQIELERQNEELRQARDAAEAANRATSTFWAAMSHELRTPMSAIIGLGGMVLQTELTSQQRDYLTKIETSAHSLLRLINDTLDYSKIEAGKLILEQVDFSLREVLDRVTSSMNGDALEKGLVLYVDLDWKAPDRLVGDPYRLEQVLNNLLVNALTFTKKGLISLAVSVLEVEEITREAVLCFSVKDSGIGMTREQIAGLFQPFIQADRSTSRCYGGTGLGLSICKNLVESMGGGIGAEAEPGRGSTFLFTATFGLSTRDPLLPVQDRAVTVVTPKPDALRGVHMLLVEDLVINQQVAREQLEGLGIVVEVAQNGREAVEVMAQRGDRFDGILMDIQMPVMDGYEATRLIRTQWSTDRLPIIAMTAHARDEDREKCLQAGMTAHIAKPVEQADLYNCLAAVIRRDPDSTRTPDEVASTPRSLVPDFPACLPGFAVAEGLARLKGNAPLYRKLITMFCRDRQNCSEEIGAALAGGDLDRARFLAHGLKGVAGNLAATGLYATACALDAACTQGAAQAARNLLPALTTDLAEVMAAATLLEESSPKRDSGKTGGEFAPDVVLSLLRVLGPLATRHDLRALDQMDRLQDLLSGTEYAPLGARLAEILDRMDFEEGIRHLETLTTLVARLTEEGHNE